MKETYYSKHKEEILERQKKYIESNKEKVLQQKREWQRKYRAKLREKGLLSPTKKQLEQENKQLKEDFAVLKKIQMISNDILNELEEWLKEEIDDFKQDGYDNSEKRKDSLWLAGVYDQDKRILDKIQELKEKYK